MSVPDELRRYVPRTDLYDSAELISYHMPIEQPPATASYIIFKKGNKTYAKNGTYGHIEYENTDPPNVIQYALNNLTPNRTWKEKVVLKGDFEISTPISIPSYTIFEVYGRLRSKDGLNLYAVLVKNAEHVDINISELDGNAAGQSDGVFPEVPYGLHVWLSKWVTIKGHYYNAYRENIHIYQCENVFLDVSVEKSAHYEGLAITGESGNPCRNIAGKVISKDNALAGVHTHHYCYDIDLTVIDDGSKYGLEVYKSMRSRFRVISENAKEYGVSLSEATDCQISAIIKNATSFGLNAYNLTGCKLDVISLNSGGAGLHIDDSSDCKIFAYIKESGGRGIEGGNNHRNKIEGYVISNNGNGLDFWEGSTENIITLVAIDNTGLYGLYLYDSQHNRFINCKVSGHNTGIGTGGTSDYNEVRFCDVRNNTNPISLVGANNKVKFNKGYVTENSGTATIPSGQTSVTVEHGLAGTPTSVVLGPTHAEVADAVWSADETNITITVPSAVSADRQISWYAEYKP